MASNSVASCEVHGERIMGFGGSMQLCLGEKISRLSDVLSTRSEKLMESGE